MMFAAARWTLTLCRLNMPAFYTIRYPATGEESEWFGGRGYYYEFDDGVSVTLNPRMAWCCQCNQFVDAEFIRDVGDYENELQDIADPNGERCRVFKERSPTDTPEQIARSQRLLAEAAAEAKRKILWRKERLSPPKCLCCGSTEILFRGDGHKMDVPGHGIIEIECTGMCSTNFMNWFYTPEGDRIPRDTKPSYWHLPNTDSACKIIVPARWSLPLCGYRVGVPFYEQSISIARINLSTKHRWRYAPRLEMDGLICLWALHIVHVWHYRKNESSK